ncbi:MAG TPA: aminodeoxychorismate synthase component I, partial [Pyrinomonadaceae bacterium]|nr:aminodeoxychorismate synthase component I [Pyrinomonadaceae bacterium]
MHQIDISAANLISSLLHLSETEPVCILDSCGVGHLGSHLMVAGIDPVEILEISHEDPEQTLAILDQRFTDDLACIFTISYDFGIKLLGIQPRIKEFSSPPEPDLFIARFDSLVIHDYDNASTKIVGNPDKFDSVSNKLIANICSFKFEISNNFSAVSSNFSRAEYLQAIGSIKESIRRGDTYQTNLTQQFTADLPNAPSPQEIFYRLRQDHPAPFAAFLKRMDSSVVSASPERFLHIGDGKISTSPIKGTRPRGQTADEDATLRSELLTSAKDRAENTMIVDLLRNDLGRVCEYGSVEVEKLCDLAEYPTLFHLVSTVSGDLRPGTKFSEILKAVFPCGSITGAPKISTMRIIDEIETVNRGLSMGAIGYYVPRGGGSLDFGLGTLDSICDLSVAIRTMVVRNHTATFNVGGGIVIDSDPDAEFDESLTKGKALF